MVAVLDCHPSPDNDDGHGITEAEVKYRTNGKYKHIWCLLQQNSNHCKRLSVYHVLCSA